MLLRWAGPGHASTTRAFALAALSRCPSSPRLRRVLAVSVSRDPLNLRVRALESLGHHLGPSSTPMLLSLLARTDRTAAERLTALRYLAASLQKEAGPEAESVLLDSFRGRSGLADRHMASRAAIFALTALARLHLERHTSLLLACGRDPEPDVRVAALDALATVWSGRAGPHPTALVKLAERALRLGEAAEQLAAIRLLRTLEELGDRAAAELLFARGTPGKRDPKNRLGFTVTRSLLHESPSRYADITAVLLPGALVYDTQGGTAGDPPSPDWVHVRVSGGRAGWLQRPSVDFSGPPQSSLDTTERGSN